MITELEATTAEYQKVEDSQATVAAHATPTTISLARQHCVAEAETCAQEQLRKF